MKDLQETVALSGATKRQIDYWTSRGLLPIERVTYSSNDIEVTRNPRSPGSGHKRYWTDYAVRKAEIMAKLSSLGMATDRAADVAAELLDSGECELPGHFVLSLDRTFWGDPL